MKPKDLTELKRIIAENPNWVNEFNNFKPEKQSVGKGGVLPLGLLIEKARKYDELEKLVNSFYIDPDGNEVEDERGLDDIGEAVARYFKYI